jgi:hypothetical protein
MTEKIKSEDWEAEANSMTEQGYILVTDEEGETYWEFAE